MSNLITESIDEKPLVVLVGDDNQLSAHISQLFVSNDVSVFQIKKDDFNSSDFLKLIKSKTSLYKIFWLTGFDDSVGFVDENILSTLDEISKYHQGVGGQTSPITIVLNQETKINVGVELYEGYELNIQAKSELLRKILDKYQKFQVVVVKDCLGDQDKTLFPLNHFLGFIKLGKIYNPRQNFYFQTSEDVFNNISKILIKPFSTAKFLIKGKKVDSNEVCVQITNLFQKYFNKEITTLEIGEIKNDYDNEKSDQELKRSGFIEVNNSNNSLEEFLDVVVRRFQTLRISNKTVSLGMEELEKKHRESFLKAQKTSFPLPHQQEREVEEKTPQITSHEKLKKWDGGLRKIDASFSNLILQDSINSNQPLSIVENQKTNQFIKRKIESSRSAIDENIDISGKNPTNADLTPDKKATKKVVVEKELESDILKLFGEVREEVKDERIEKKHHKKTKIVKKSKRKKTMFYGGVFIVGFGVLISFFMILFQASLFFFKQDLSNYVSNNFLQPNSREESGGIGEDFVSFWQKIVEIKGLVLSTVFSEDILNDYSYYLSVAEKINNVKRLSEDLNTDILYFYTEVMRGSGVGEANISSLINNSQLLFESLTQVSGDLKKIDDGSSQKDSSSINQLTQIILDRRQKLSYYNQYRSFLSTFLGIEQKRIYAVVLQNNLELRPTGGFIQSVALLTFDKGMLIDTKVMGVYEIDDKLMSVVMPPEEMKKVLGEERWYLRDSNWDPDFYNSSKNISWFIEEGLGVKVDGVIAVNLNVIQNLLEVVGDISLAQHNEVITSKNIFERVEYHSKNDVEEKDYLTHLFEKTIYSLKELSNDQVLGLVSVLSKSLAEKEMLVGFVKEDENQVLNELGWDGRLIQPNCPSQLASSDCMVDYIYQVEANSGLNKVNAYIQRSVDHSIVVGDDKVKHTRKITYKNNSKSNTWPQGTYRTYIRFFVHEGAVLEQVVLGNKSVDLGLITKYKNQNRNVYGILLEVPSNQETSLAVSYSVANTVLGGENTSNRKFSYVFFDQKQPGWINDRLNISLINNSNYTPKTIAPQATIENNIVVFDVDRGEHAFVGIELQK